MDSGKDIAVDIPLKLPNIKIPGSTFGADGKYQIIDTTIESVQSANRPGCGPDRFDLSFRVYTKYDIKGEAIDMKPEMPMKNSSLSHHYEFKNIGPSASSQPYHFRMFLPKNLEPEVDKNPAPRINCSKSLSPGSEKSLRQIITTSECIDLEPTFAPSIPGVDDFVEYVCDVDQGWEKDNRYKIIVKMEFNTTMAMNKKEGKLHDNFLVPTFIKTEKLCLSYKTIFTTSDIGKSAVIQQIWPIILGVCISAVLFAVVMVVMYKKGWLSKLRFYKQDDEIGNVTELGQLQN